MSDQPTVAEVQTLIDYVQTLEDRAKQDADALRSVTMERATLRTEVARLTARVAELEAHVDKYHPPRCRHLGFGEHSPLHGAHTIGHGLPDDETRLSPEEAEIEVLRARVAELEAPGECASIHKLQAKLSEVTAERDRMWSAVDQLRNFGESSGDAVERIVSELFEAHTLASGRLGERAVDAVARLAKDRTAGYERATAAEAERDRLAEELEAERSGEVCGMLADLCDILFEDKERAATHGYEGVVDKAREVVAERDRYKTGCEHYLERAETVRHLMTVGEDVVGTLHRMAGEYVQVSFSRWRWRRMATDGVPNDTERALRREWLVSDDRAILVAAFGADVVAKVEAS